MWWPGPGADIHVVMSLYVVTLKLKDTREAAGVGEPPKQVSP